MPKSYSRPSFSTWLVVLVFLLCFGGCLVSAQQQPARRSLTQQDSALSNSNGCLDSIPKCEPGACATRNVMGVARWVCLRCLANYEPVVDASGQDNILQCVCPRGFFESVSTATSCTRCPANSYCPGGDKVENPTSRGSNMTCGTNLVTRNTGARTQSDCVAPAGYARTSPSSGTACSVSEYAPQFNRLAKCLRCQSGLAEPPNSSLTDGQRTSKRTVCKIPPGKYVSQGLVRICPQGFYRENFVDFDAALGTLCLPCRPGITTEGAGAEGPWKCAKVLPGYGISSVENVASAADIPALIVPADGLPNATICDIGYYSLNGYCAACPQATVTTVKGAKTIEECVVPPGYFLPSAGAAMTQCTAGNFREGWLMFSDTKAQACTPCGVGIDSEPRDMDENPKATNGSLVRATPTSCFIEAGMGMIAQGKNLFVGKDCPANTYGAAGKVYGWAAAPCKPCPRNMITDGATRVNSSDACINDDGWGYASEGASRCAPGFYSAKGSRKPCLTCAVNRITYDDASQQRYITDCRVRPGFGVVRSSSNSSSSSPMTCADAFSPDTTGLSEAELVTLAVLECPVGYYSSAFTVGAMCVKCPGGSSTQQPGSTNVTDCNVCMAGYGRQGGSNVCTPCTYGTHQPGGLTECSACPTVPFYAPVDGSGTTWVSNSTTLFTAAYGAEACVPQQSQLSPEAGQAFFAQESPMQSLLTSTQQPDLAACLASCPASSCCMAQYEVTNATCRTAALMPAQADTPITSLLLRYKLPPSAMGAAASVPDSSGGEQKRVAAKTISSGYYASCVLPDDSAVTWAEGAGSNLGADAFTFVTGDPVWDSGTTQAACQARCDDSNVCWGYVWEGQSESCLYRGGVDALATRSFFVLPSASAVDLGSLGWASAAPSAANGVMCSVMPSANGSVTLVDAGTNSSSSNSSTTATTNGTQISPSPTPSIANGALPVPPAPASPSPQPSLVPSPSPSPSPEPVVVPSPSPVMPSPSPSPVVSPSPEPVVVPSPSPVVPSPSLSPAPAPTIENGALPLPPPPTRSPSPKPSPSPSPAPTGPTSIIATIAGLYQQLSPNTIISYTPYRGYPTLTGEGMVANTTVIGTPEDIVQDSAGHIYFLDSFVGVIRKIDANTRILTTIAGNNTAKAFRGDGGPATKAFFNVPSGLAIWQDILYVADQYNGAIRRINLTTGIITTVAGNGTLGRGYSGDNGPALSAQISPAAVAIDPRNGDIILAEYQYPRVRRVNVATGIITTIAGNGTLGTGIGKDWGMGGFANQTAIAVPRGITVDPAGNVLFACDIGSVVQRIDAATGRISIVVGYLTRTNYSGDGGAAVNASVWNPTDVKVDPQGNIWVSDPYNRVIRRIDGATGIITTVVGRNIKTSGQPSGDGGHPSQGALGSGTQRIFFGRNNELFIADKGNYAVRKVTLYNTLR